MAIREMVATWCVIMTGKSLRRVSQKISMKMEASMKASSEQYTWRSASLRK